MKRVRSYESGVRSFLLSVLALLMFLPAGGQTIGESVYVYRNDGDFNAFYRDEVERIEYSYEDADGITYDDIVTQIVYTADSTYYIPIAAIDSVSFVQPETLYKSDVVRMEPLLPYIVSVDGMTITFSPGVPSNVLPKVGDVLLQDNFYSELLPDGFAGRVVDCSVQEVVCESVSFEEIYDRIVCYGRYMAVEDEASGKMRLAPRKASGGVSSAIGINVSVGKGDSGLFLNIAGKLGLDLRATFKFETGKSPFLDISAAPELNVGFEAGVKGKLEGNTLSKLVKLFVVPIPDTPFLLKLEGGPVLKPTLEASLTFSTQASLGYKFGIKFENGGFHGYGENTSKWFAMPEIDGYISGSLFAGLRTEFGITTYGDLLSLELVKEAGAEFEGNITENMLSTDKYQELQEAQLDLNLAASIAVEGKIQFFKYLKAEPSFELLSGKTTINSWKLVPSFQEPDVQVNNTTAVISVTPSEKLLFPVGIGVGVWDENGSLCGSQYCSDTYRIKEEWSYEDYQAVFEGFTEGQTYTARPLITLLGMNIIASPEKDFTIKDNDNPDDPDNPDGPDNPDTERIYLQCPDDNHPHAITLGWGGTWACCNVGASSPEQYGDYFAWGETYTRGIYTWENYAFYDSSMGRCIDIGSDIAGTQYDTAKANWGNHWVMPSLDDFYALLNNCYWEWTSNGMKIVGNNGGTIFLPAAGDRFGEEGAEGGGAGEIGGYWSSTIHCISGPYPNIEGAFALIFSSDGVDTRENYRGDGLSVRPIYK